jgi:CelD/BcsL family acetyltransferase involved in cellulose biosynthesis
MMNDLSHSSDAHHPLSPTIKVFATQERKNKTKERLNERTIERTKERKNERKKQRKNERKNERRKGIYECVMSRVDE